jgi:GNAT superfamily N-acetyltransferase
VRENWGGPGTPLAGAMLWRPSASQIGWLAVARRWQRRGIGSALLSHVVALATGPEVRVVTFADEVVGGEAARAFYLRHGFVPVAIDDPTPQRETFALILPDDD